MKASAAIVTATMVAATTAGVHKPYNGLASTPMMGWNNWATFHCDVNEGLLLGTAQKIVDLGLRKVGYEFVVLDDCWSDGRDDEGKLRHDEGKFPNGMKYVADKLHSMDLKYGMYSSAGEWTCAGYPGSLGHEEDDAQTFADYGVDLLKYDNCHNSGQCGSPHLSFERYKKMSDALLATNRSIVYSLCNWGEDGPWDWAPQISNSWRISGDLYDSFDRPDYRCPCDDNEYICKLAGYYCSMMNILNKAASCTSKGHTGAWNDLDIMEVGHGGCDDEEYKSHFSMWALMKSPLMIGADVRSLSPEAYTILTNPAILAINQDPAGQSISRLWQKKVKDVDEYERGEIQAWSGPLDNGDFVVALLNAGAKGREMAVTIDEVFVSEGPKGSAKESQQDWDLYDLWANRMSNEEAAEIIAGNKPATVYDTAEMDYAEGLSIEDPRLMGKKVGSVKAHGTIKARVAPHGVVVYRLRPARVVNEKEDL